MTSDEANVKTFEINNLVLKVREAVGGEPSPVVMMFHGWTGDEDSMWVFAGKMPANALLISPRGLYPSTFGGFSWYPDSISELPVIGDFSAAIDAVVQIQGFDIFNHADFSQLRLVGFSQGAALAYSFAIRNPGKVRAIAGLSGFVPGEIDRYFDEKPMDNLPIFVAHGVHDQLVPVQNAREGVQKLRKLGAIVDYCEDEVGHRLSATCYRGMQEFLRDH